MARPASKEPTDGEMEILNILWESGPCGLGTIYESICRARPVANTTVATMLKVMLQKGLVNRSQGERGYLWSADVTRRKVASGLLRRLLDSAFNGSAQRLVAHLLEEKHLSKKDRGDIRKLLNESKNRSKRSEGADS